MKQMLPGIFHWTSLHPRIGIVVHSYYVSAVNPAILIDPRLPAEGLGWFKRRPRPEHVYLTNRHHYRQSDRFEKAYGCKVWCHRKGLHEFTKGQKVAPFDHGDELPGGVLALEVGSLCPEETALFLPVAGGILAIGDAVIRNGSRLGFVPDPFMGDDPAEVKRGLRRQLGRIARRRFDHLLLAHGSPIKGGARERLRSFLDRLR